MRISAISNYNNQTRIQNTKSQKTTPVTNRQPSFNGYKEELIAGFDVAINDKWDMGYLFQRLLDSAKEIPGAKVTDIARKILTYFNIQFYDNYENLYNAVICTSHIANDEIYGTDPMVKTDDYCFMKRCGRTIEFRHPEVNGTIEFWRGQSSNDVYIKRPTLKQGFYNSNGRIKEETIYADWCSPTTYYYNEDGSQKGGLKGFLGSIGF